MNAVCTKCDKAFTSLSKDSKTLQYYRICESCNKTDISVDCVNYEKFNQLIKDLHASIERNKHVVKVVEGERGSIRYMIEQMNHDLIKLKIKSESVNDRDNKLEVIRLNEKS